MKRLARLFPLLAFAIMLGFLPALTWGPEPADPDPEPGSLREVLAEFSTLTGFYNDWQARYAATGGDRQVEVALGWARGLSTEPRLGISGRARIDLLGGEVTVTVDRIASGSADVWLVDNLPGTGRSALPEPGDHMVKVGRLTGDGDSVAARRAFGETFFRDFELDQVVVTRAGEDPARSRVLVGTRPFFERLYTRSRLAAERQRPEWPSLAALRSLPSAFAPRPAHASFNQFFVNKGLVSQIVADGADLFFEGTFGGNGRTCGTCHPPENNQTVEPAFIATLPASDPLFVAEHTTGGVPGLERPDLMRGFGLILENLDGFEDPEVKRVMRSVPHTLSLATSIDAPPLDDRPQIERTGWSGDGSPGDGSLRLFPMGAVFQHFTKSLARNDQGPNPDFVFPTEAELDAMEAFALSVGRLNEIPIAPTSLVLNDPDADAGRDLFRNPVTGKCRFCHINAGANVTFFVNGQQSPGNQNVDTGVEDRTHPARAVEDFPFDGGHDLDPRDCDGVGGDDCFGDGTFNVPPLIESADTGPFFHNNVETTLEDAVKFYSGPEFNASPGGAFSNGINLAEFQSEQIAAFLRVLNAAFNIDLADQKCDAAARLLKKPTPIPCEQGPSGPINCIDAVAGLLELANAEAWDAVGVLQARGLHPTAVTRLNEAISITQQAIDELSPKPRRQLVLQAITKLGQAKTDLGSGFDYVLGEGNLLF